MAQAGQALARAALAFRAPPPEPTTCCGRGCNGCVWDGWFAAVQWWLDEAAALLDAKAGKPSRT